MYRSALLFLICALSLSVCFSPTISAGDLPDENNAGSGSARNRPTSRPALTQRLLIVSVDGLRPDMLLRCRTPHMHALFEGGTYSFWARTTPHAITLPSHTSMLTGVIPRKHEIEWNKELNLVEPVYPKYPTLFAVAHKAGFTTALLAGKNKFGTLASPGSLSWQWITDSEKSEDPGIVSRAETMIREYQPQLMFVHLPSVDNAGHKFGWGTPEQVKAVEQADKCVGLLLVTLDELKLRESTVILLTSDHGGAGKTHLPDDARARHIPWIVNGRGIRKGVDLTVYPELIINTEDTFATACHLLGLSIGRDIDGKPIMEILEDRGELLHVAGPRESGT
jgi:arylsulfatase A-like enzyme